jgi:hypothetical protein
MSRIFSFSSKDSCCEAPCFPTLSPHAASDVCEPRSQRGEEMRWGKITGSNRLPPAGSSSVETGTSCNPGYGDIGKLIWIHSTNPRGFWLKRRGGIFLKGEAVQRGSRINRYRAIPNVLGYRSRGYRWSYLSISASPFSAQTRSVHQSLPGVLAARSDAAEDSFCTV